MTAPGARAIRGWVWAGVAALPVSLTITWIGLNHDVRYVLGGLRVTGGSTGVFVHRPLLYRWLADGLGVFDVGSVGIGEGLVRLVALLVVAGAAWWLRAGLRRALPAGEASAVAAATGFALALAPNGDFLQPEWVAAVAGVAAVGAALTPSTVLVAGVFLGLSVLVGYGSWPAAVIALGVVAVLDRRRALAAGGAAVVSGGALFGVTLLAPRELRWFAERFAVDGAATREVGAALRFLANEAMLVPVIALLPASLVVLLRVSARRSLWPVLVVAAVAVVVAAAVARGQWFQYQAAPLVPLAAALWASAVARWTLRHGRPPWALVGATVVVLFAARVFLGASFAWRSQHGALAYGVLGGLVALSAVACALEPGRNGRAVLSVPVLVGLLALCVPILPTSPYSFDGVGADYTNAGRVAVEHEFTAELAEVRDRIGAGTPVVYLAFGDVAYFLGNPTPCAYPSPAYLDAGLTGTSGYAENRACLTDPAVRYVVLQPRWFEPGPLTGLIAHRFDCARAVATANVLACPVRDGARQRYWPVPLIPGCGPSCPACPPAGRPRRICSNCTRAAICCANSAVWMPWKRPSSQPTSCAWAIRSSASDGVLPSVNGWTSRSSSLCSSGASACSSSLIEVWWISRNRSRLASSSGAARTSSRSCLIIVPMRMTFAGSSTRSPTDSWCSSSSLGIRAVPTGDPSGPTTTTRCGCSSGVFDSENFGSVMAPSCLLRQRTVFEPSGRTRSWSAAAQPRTHSETTRPYGVVHGVRRRSNSWVVPRAG